MAVIYMWITQESSAHPCTFSRLLAIFYPHRWNVLLLRGENLKFAQSQTAQYSASHVLAATGFVSGKGQFSTPSTDHQKIVKSDYVGDLNSCAKLGSHPSIGASGHMGEI